MSMLKKLTFSLFPNLMIFENSSSTNIMIMEEFHDFAMLYLICIMIFLSVVIVRIMISKFFNLNFMENTSLEIIWTIIPMGILIFLAYPSIYYLYLFDLSFNPMVMIKVFGFQWYWSYENFISNIKSDNLHSTEFNFSKMNKKSYSLNSEFFLNLEESEKCSYLIQDLELIKSFSYLKGWRLLETDNRLIVPYGMEIQCLTTSLDVIHSFSIPDLGIKVDAIPGRLNSISFEILKPGLYYGQCSEICGTGHAFMPISMEAF